jgi:ribosomal protein L7/L12
MTMDPPEIARLVALERKVAQIYEHLGIAEPAPAAATGDVDPRVLDAIQAGNEIEAIKFQREVTGAGLVEAKQAVEEIMAQRKALGL